MNQPFEAVRIGVVSVSDRASAGVYPDQGIPALKAWLGQALRNPIEWHERLMPTSRPASAPRCASWPTRCTAPWC